MPGERTRRHTVAVPEETWRVDARPVPEAGGHLQGEASRQMRQLLETDTDSD